MYASNGTVTPSSCAPLTESLLLRSCRSSSGTCLPEIPTLNSIVTDLEATRNGAWQDRNWSAARGSILGLARVSGHMKDDPTKVGDVHIHLTQIMAGVL